MKITSIIKDRAELVFESLSKYCITIDYGATQKFTDLQITGSCPGEILNVRSVLSLKML